MGAAQPEAGSILAVLTGWARRTGWPRLTGWTWWPRLTWRTGCTWRTILQRGQARFQVAHQVGDGQRLLGLHARQVGQRHVHAHAQQFAIAFQAVDGFRCLFTDQAKQADCAWRAIRRRNL